MRHVISLPFAPYPGGPMTQPSQIGIWHYSRREPSGGNGPPNGDSSGDCWPPEQEYPDNGSPQSDNGDPNRGPPKGDPPGGRARPIW